MVGNSQGQPRRLGNDYLCSDQSVSIGLSVPSQPSQHNREIYMENSLYSAFRDFTNSVGRSRRLGGWEKRANREAPAVNPGVPLAGQEGLCRFS